MLFTIVIGKVTQLQWTEDSIQFQKMNSFTGEASTVPFTACNFSGDGKVVVASSTDSFLYRLIAFQLASSSFLCLLCCVVYTAYSFSIKNRCLIGKKCVHDDGVCSMTLDNRYHVLLHICAILHDYECMILVIDMKY